MNESAELEAIAQRPIEGVEAYSLTPRPTIFIVSHVRLLREGLLWQLERDGRLDVCGAAPPTSATIEHLARQSPVAAALDLSTIGMLDFAEQLQARAPEIKLVGFALGEFDGTIADWARLGICGYVEREGTAADIVETVFHALNGELYCSPRFAANLLSQLAGQNPTPTRTQNAVMSNLTPREMQILQKITLGESNKEIARHLGISAATVKNHVHNVLEKLHVHRRSQASALATFAARNG